MVGEGGLDDCLRKFRTLQSTTNLGLLSGTTKPNTSVLALLNDVMVNQTYSDENGSFEMQLAPGTYVLSVEGVLSDPIEVIANDVVTASASASASGFLKYECNVPCKISLQPGPAAPLTSPVDLSTLTFSITGSGQLAASPGDWTVTLSRGWEYSIHREDVTLTEGETTQVSATLERQVDTTGFIAADLHTHCTRSLDSVFAIADKLASNIAEGIELVVSTDHDAQTNYRPVLKELQAEDLIRVVVGCEISALYGHSVVYPLPVHPLGWNYWSFPWTLYADDLFVRQLEYPEIWPHARELGRWRAEVMGACRPGVWRRGRWCR